MRVLSVTVTHLFNKVTTLNSVPLPGPNICKPSQGSITDSEKSKESSGLISRAYPLQNLKIEMKWKLNQGQGEKCR